MTSVLFNRMMKLCQSWPKDPTKTTRDFGAHLEKQLKIWFPKGELTKLDDPKELERQIASLERLNSDFYRKKYHDSKVAKLLPASLFTKEEIKTTLSTEFLEKNEEMQRISNRIKDSIKNHPYTEQKKLKKLID